MALPNNINEKEFLETVNKITRMLALSFKFGYHTLDDIKQQIMLFALAGLNKYDGIRPLGGFLYTHVKNRLINFKRDNYRRTDSPCKLCYGCSDGTTKHEDGLFCDKYTKWECKNVIKQNIIHPLDITSINDELESNTRTASSVVSDVCMLESLEMIDQELPIDLRATYLQMKEGLNIGKVKRDELVAAMALILGEEVNV